MPLAQYPSDLPLPQWSGYSGEARSGFKFIPMQSGHTRSRREHFSPPSPGKVEFMFTDEQMQRFETWHEDEINGGTDDFTITLRTDAGLVEHEVRFTDDYDVSAVPPNHWKVTASIEVIGEA